MAGRPRWSEWTDDALERRARLATDYAAYISRSVLPPYGRKGPGCGVERARQLERALAAWRRVRGKKG